MTTKQFISFPYTLDYKSVLTQSVWPRSHKSSLASVSFWPHILQPQSWPQPHYFRASLTSLNSNDLTVLQRT